MDKFNKICALKEGAVEQHHTFKVGDVVYLEYVDAAGKTRHGTTNVDKATSAYVYATHPAGLGSTDPLLSKPMKFHQGVNGKGGNAVGELPGSIKGGHRIVKHSQTMTEESSEPRKTISKIDKYGNKRWYNENGQLHSVDDKPAFVSVGGNKQWFKNGVLHRDDDKPATEFADGSKHWYKNGKLHRDGDEPAMDEVAGTKRWYKNGKLHRDGDKPAMVYTSGTKFWYKNDKRHRDGDKPAVEREDGTYEYWKNGKQYTPGHTNESFDASFITEALDRIAISILESSQEQIDELSKTTLASCTRQIMSENKITELGVVRFDELGRFHGSSDKPAIEHVNGDKFWYKHGKIHRDDDKPAVEYANGSKHWYKNGERHRDDAHPAVVGASGYKEYWKNGKQYTPKTSK